MRLRIPTILASMLLAVSVQASNEAEHPELKDQIKHLEDRVLSNEMSSFMAAGELLDRYGGLFKDDLKPDSKGWL